MTLPAKDIVIIGGGPSGLSAAYEAVKHGARPVVLEKLERVGGLARTIPFHQSRFDIGPHRFFTMNKEVEQLFIDVTGEDMIKVARLTRIFYRKKYFNYPLTPLNALFGVGLANSVLILASYARARLRRLTGATRIVSFEDWVIDRFGDRLYRTFFKTYTEKVWGIPCDRIGADWASQRIKGLSLVTAVMNALFRPKRKIKTLVDEFMYPRLGAGQLYEKMAARVVEGKGTVTVGQRVEAIHRDGARVTAISVAEDGKKARKVGADFFLASSPLTEILEIMEPPPPEEVLRASRALRYRGHVGVKLEVRGVPFPDNWIYVHSPDVKMARISNYRNFSAEMSADKGISPLTVEYFVFEGDEVWSAPDEELIALAERELVRMEILEPGKVVRGFVVRSQKAYPVIEQGYEQHIDVIRGWMAGLENFLPIGRSGMFKYNNQDHAMATGLLAARTALGLGTYDPWQVNIDGEYHEGGRVE